MPCPGSHCPVARRARSAASPQRRSQCHPGCAAVTLSCSRKTRAAGSRTPRGDSAPADPAGRGGRRWVEARPRYTACPTDPAGEQVPDLDHRAAPDLDHRGRQAASPCPTPRTARRRAGAQPTWGCSRPPARLRPRPCRPPGRGPLRAGVCRRRRGRAGEAGGEAWGCCPARPRARPPAGACTAAATQSRPRPRRPRALCGRDGPPVFGQTRQRPRGETQNGPGRHQPSC
mmetsp:Transcript_4042/g.11483  ORF Transcript_4042/g.11483 Transcript_4042/m.11483 type:complete len:230 (+) Transcript_4042:602-1291(+)